MFRAMGLDRAFQFIHSFRGLIQFRAQRRTIVAMRHGKRIGGMHSRPLGNGLHVKL